MLRHIPDFLNPSALNIIINLMTHSAGLLLNQLFAIVQENPEPMKKKKTSPSFFFSPPSANQASSSRYSSAT